MKETRLEKLDSFKQQKVAIAQGRLQPVYFARKKKKKDYIDCLRSYPEYGLD